MIALTPDETQEFTVEAQAAKPESEREQYLLKPLRYKDRKKLVIMLGGNVQLSDQSDVAKHMDRMAMSDFFDFAELVLCAGIAGWQNKPVDCPLDPDTKRMALDGLDYIPQSEWPELIKGIMEISGLSGDDKKN